MAAKIIDGSDVQSMVSHWLGTPQNGYLGSGYGQDVKALLQNPQLDGAPEALIEKLRNDVPLLQGLPSGAVNLYSVQSGYDKLDLVIEVAGNAIQIQDVK